MSHYDTYTSPLASRNASEAMLRLWSPRHKFNMWRRIWLAVAEAQHELTSGPSVSGTGGDGYATQGQPLVSKEQVEELRAVVNRSGGIRDEEIELAEQYERELRHDVMAHVHTLGDSCPKAKGIIHLGMTSQDVVCNADLNILFATLRLIEAKTVRVVDAYATCAQRYARVPALGFTHYQPAQPVTVGRRCALWAHDLLLTQARINTTISSLRLRGLRGATGTQASFDALLGKKLESGPSAFEHKAMQRLWADPLLERAYEVTGQTYPRVVDTFILADLASVAAVLHKIATDIRLLCNRKELDEPFETRQVGSSAMPYKRNPMRCERICGLARFVMNLVGNAYDTAATQWLERTLDDSSNRRLSLPEAFLALDGALDIMHNVASGLIVHEAMVRKNLMAELPFMATENILMECVKLYVGFAIGVQQDSAVGTPSLREGNMLQGQVSGKEKLPSRSEGVPKGVPMEVLGGGDRQVYHELIRQHAQAAGMRVKQEGLDNDLLERLKADKHFWSIKRGGPLREELDWEGVMDPMKYIGRSIEQTERFIKDVVNPLREQHKDELANLEESAPKV
mgnify:CR=1 FL=1